MANESVPNVQSYAIQSLKRWLPGGPLAFLGAGGSLPPGNEILRVSRQTPNWPGNSVSRCYQVGGLSLLGQGVVEEVGFGAFQVVRTLCWTFWWSLWPRSGQNNCPKIRTKSERF